MYKVILWGTRTVIQTFVSLRPAQRCARKQGYDENLSNGKYYAPLAYVEDESGYCVYNPRFMVKEPLTIERRDDGE
jgi:hypothetical protein